MWFTFRRPHQPGAEAEFEVHAQGCRDAALTMQGPSAVAARASGFSSNKWNVFAADVEEAVKHVVEDLADQDTTWQRQDFHVMPCAERTEG